ncbi:flagellar hook-length control protein FliK [Pseudomonas sp. TE3786]
MSVASDPLLNSAPVAKPQSAPAKSQQKSAEPSNDDASSFAKVYAKERQDKAVDRNEAAAKSKQAKSNDKADDKQAAEETPAAASKDEPAVADSGNPLPTDPADADPVIDPMILLAMAGQQLQQPTTPQDATSPTTGEGGSGLEIPLSLTGLTTAQITQTEDDGHDPQVDAMSELPGVDLMLDLAAKAQAATQKGGSNPSAAQAGQTGGQDFAAAMAQLTAKPEGGESQVTDELALLDKGKDGIEALKDSNADLHGDAFANKLSALNQAVNQQVTQAQRTPVVPGAPVSMQQGVWTDEVVDKVMWMSSQNLKSADIQLDPPDLGRLEVRINMSQDAATQVTFASPHVGVRDAVTESMHRLREMFTQQGMSMDVNVSDQSLNRGWAGQNGNDGQQSRGGSSGGNSLLGGDEEISVSTSEIRSSGSMAGGRGLVDYYA